MDQSPAPGGTRYGVPARRKEITGRLSEAYSRDMLEQREFETRLERAEAAQTIEELDALVADFGPGAPEVPAAGGGRHLSILGDQTHVLVPGAEESFRGLALLGNFTVDLRAFRGSGKTLTVRLSGFLGDAKVLVPPGTRVIRRSTLFLGDYRVQRAREPGGIKKFLTQVFGRSDPPPGSPFPPDGTPPTVVLTGIRLLGDVVVEEALP